MSLLLGACGLSPSSFSPAAGLGNKNQPHHAEPEAEDLHVPQGAISSGAPVIKRPADKDVAAEPAPVGGAYLSCKTEIETTSFDMAHVTCVFDPAGAPAGAAGAVSFSFAQGPMRDAATPIDPIEQDAMQVDPSSMKWNYSFRFGRKGLKGPNLYVSATDNTRVPPMTHTAGADLRGMELLSLVGDFTAATLGTDQTWPVGASDQACGAVAEDKVNKLGISHTWPFEVVSDTVMLTIKIRGVCGVLQAEPGLNSFFLERIGDGGFINGGNRTIERLPLLYNVPDPSLGPVTLPKGLYNFKSVSSPSTRGVLDNIIIGDLLIEVKGGAIEMGEESRGFSKTNVEQR